MEVSFENLGTVNKNRVRVGDVTLYFSYQTCVGFVSPDDKATRENEWGPTTGKLLSMLEPDKKKRVSGEEFNRRLTIALGKTCADR